MNGRRKFCGVRKKEIFWSLRSNVSIALRKLAFYFETYISVAFPSGKTIQQSFPTFSFSFLLTKFILRKGPKLWCNGIKRHCMPAYMYPFLHDKSKVNQTSFIVVIHIICLIYIQIISFL